MTIAELPNDIDTLKSLIIAQHETLHKEVNARDTKIAELESQLAYMKRMLFGRRSEKIDQNQLLLFKELQERLEALQQEYDNRETEKITYTRKKGHGRKPLPDDLPAEDVEYLPESLDCPCCRAEMSRIGEEVTEELEYTPGTLFKRRHIRPKYACRRCENGVHIAPMPSRPIDKGIPGPGLLAHVLTSKYADHAPLNRLRGMLRRHGVDISVPTLCDWVGRMAVLLGPVYEHLKSQLLGGSQIQSDATEVPYLLRSDVKKRATGYLWTYLCESSRLVLYDFTTSQQRAGPTRFLQGFCGGALLTDGHASYNEVIQRASLVRAGCWVHARRKYYNARLDDRRRCDLMIKLIRDLFAVERKAREAREKSAAAAGTAVSSVFGDAEHLALRREESVPLVDRIRDCVDEWSLTVLPRSSVGKAVTYMRNQWAPLNAFLADPTLPIHNNASERALRHVVVGRNNWTFAGSESGGHRAAIIYSLVSTCKANGLDPFAYFNDVIDRLPRGEDPAGLTPAAWMVGQLRQADTLPQQDQPPA